VTKRDAYFSSAEEGAENIIKRIGQDEEREAKSRGCCCSSSPSEESRFLFTV